jgi:hypothetical protein
VFVVTLFPGILNDRRFPLQNIPSHEELDTLFQALKDIVTHSEFQAVVAELQSLPPEELSHAVSTQLTQEALKVRGIPIPDRFTLTVNEIGPSVAVGFTVPLIRVNVYLRFR